MVKRKLQNSDSRIMRKIILDSDSSFLNKKFTVSDIKNVRKNLFKEGRNRTVDHCSSSSSCWSAEGPQEKKRKVASTKRLNDRKAKLRRRCPKDINVKKKKTVNKKTVLRTRYKNPSYCGSCESVELTEADSLRLLSHINLPSSTEQLRRANEEEQDQTRKSFCLIQPVREESSKRKELSKLDGVKFVSQMDADGSATEISFQSTLLMCVRKTSASLDVRSQRSKDKSTHLRTVEAGQLNDILSEVSAGSRGLYKCDSSNLLRMAVHNDHSKSKSNLLRLKSSQNFTDLSFQRRISHQNVNKIRSASSHSCKDLRDILLPQSIQGSTVNSSLNSKSLLLTSPNIGDHNLDWIMSDVQYTDTVRPSVPLSRSQISRIHRSRYPGTMRSAEPRVQTPSSHNTIVVQAIVNTEGDHM